MLVKTVFCLMLNLSFETLALPHENFENLLENMTISCRGMWFENVSLWITNQTFCESQSICALWNMSVCTLFQVHKCDKVNLFGRFCSLVDEKCWKFHVFSLRFLYVASQILKNVIAIFVAPVSSPFSPRYALKYQGQS